MASVKRCLGVDLGSGSVKVVEMARERAAVRIINVGKRTINLPPSASLEERAEATAAAVQEIIKEKKIAVKQAVFSVPGQAVFVKRVRLPRTTEERLHRIINYEARQQIPFPLDKTLLEFQIFDEPGDPQVEVLLVAIKRDFVETFMRTVALCKLKPILISVSSLALFNFHHFDTAALDLLGADATGSDETPAEEAEKAEPAKKRGLLGGIKLGGKKKAAKPEKEKKPEEESDDDLDFDAEADAEFGFDEMDLGVEEVKAFLNIGASTLDIVIARFGKRKTLGFTRSVPIAGNEITKMVRDRLKLESLEAADEVKRTRTAIVGDDQVVGEILPGADPEASLGATMIISRLVAEIRRTLDFYVSQPDGVTVDSIEMCGGSAHLPNLGPYMEEKLGLLVEVSQEPSNECLVSDSPPKEGWTEYLPALGLGLTGLGLGKVNIDFLPTNLKDLRQFKSKWLEIVVLAGCLGASVGFGAQMGKSDVVWYQNQMEWIEGELRGTEQLRGRGQAAISSREALKNNFEALAGLVPWRPYWPTVFRDVILQNKPQEIYLRNVSMTGHGQIRIQGFARDDGAISNFEANISNHAGDLIQIIENVSPRVYVDRSFTSNTGETVVPFEIFMLAMSRRNSDLVPFRDLRRPDPNAQQNQPQNRPADNRRRAAGSASFPVEGR